MIDLVRISAQRSQERLRPLRWCSSLRVLVVAAATSLAVSGYSSDPSAVVDNAVNERDLAIVTLTADAELRLGIESVALERRNIGRAQTRPGFVMLRPGHRFTVYAPASGVLATTLSDGGIAAGAIVRKDTPPYRLVRLEPERDTLGKDRDRIGLQQDRMRSKQDLAVAEIRLANAKLALARTERLLMDSAGSKRAADEAFAEAAQAQVAVDSAKAQLNAYDTYCLQADSSGADASSVVDIVSPIDGVIETIYAVSGQAVAAGSPIFEVANYDVMWLKVPIYVGDADRVDGDAPVDVQSIHAHSTSDVVSAKPVRAPPSADPVAATVDYHYELRNENGRYRPGERLNVIVPMRTQAPRLVVSYSAVIYDIHGGAWIYEHLPLHKFIRRRVEVDYVADDTAVLRRGPVPGTRIVTVGVAELFGTEFGVGK